MELFDRAAELELGTLGIRDLRFTFAVERTLRSTPNKAEIHVFNLTEQHRQEIAALREVRCKLSVGYRDSLHTIFSGDLRNAASRYEPPNWNTKVDGSDGGNARRRSRVQKSYPSGTAITTAIRDLADSLGLGRGNTDSVASDATLSTTGATFVRGTVLSGNAAAELDALCQSAGLEYSVQGGTLQLLPLGQGLAGDVIIVSQDTGLVGDVEVDVRTGGIKFKTLLTPDLVPGRKVEPRTRSLRGGHFRVTKAVYKGDTHGQEWYVECEASPQRSASERNAEFKRAAAAEARRIKEAAR
jgi:hypothetical protein